MNAETLLEYGETFFGRAKWAPHLNEFSVQSPFTIDHKTHLVINVEKRVYHCWLSGEGGHLSKLLWLTHKNDWKTYAQAVFGYGQLDLSKIGPQELDEPTLLDLPFRHLWDVRSWWLPKRMFEYLEARGFDVSELIRQFDIMVLADEADHMNPWFGRIVFPIREEGKIVNYIGRSVLGTRPRYLFPKATESLVVKSQLLFDAIAVDRAPYDGEPSVFVVEGVLDALKLWLLGFDAVATFGKTSSLVQASLLTQLPMKKRILYDAGAEVNSLQLAKRLIELGEDEVEIVPPPNDGSDAGDFEDPEEVIELVKSARRVSSKRFLNAWVLSRFGEKK